MRVERDAPRDIDASHHHRSMPDIASGPAVFTSKVVRIRRERSKSVSIAVRETKAVVSKEREILMKVCPHSNMQSRFIPNAARLVLINAPERRLRTRSVQAVNLFGTDRSIDVSQPS